MNLLDTLVSSGVDLGLAEAVNLIKSALKAAKRSMSKREYDKLVTDVSLALFEPNINHARVQSIFARLEASGLPPTERLINARTRYENATTAEVARPNVRTKMMAKKSSGGSSVRKSSRKPGRKTSARGPVVGGGGRLGPVRGVQHIASTQKNTDSRGASKKSAARSAGSSGAAHPGRKR